MIGGLIAGVLAASLSFSASAQTPAAPVVQPFEDAALSCPAAPLSVYFAEGEVQASDQARALIGKLQATARDCEPDEVLLVAVVDAELEGPSAEARAHDRLALLASELISGDVDAGRIVTGLREGKSTRSPDSRINAIEILLWRKGEATPAPRTPIATPVAMHISL